MRCIRKQALSEAPLTRTRMHIIVQSQPTVQLLAAPAPAPSTQLLSGSSKWCQCIYIRYYVHLDYDMTG